MLSTHADALFRLRVTILFLYCDWLSGLARGPWISNISACESEGNISMNKNQRRRRGSIEGVGNIA